MNVAVVGSSGYIAGFLLKAFQEKSEIEKVLRIGRTRDADEPLDLRKPEAFRYVVLDGIDYVIFTAAVSGPDQCAGEFDLCWQINVEGTAYFIEEAIKRGCRVIFFSSDAVFGNLPGVVYTEESKTEAVTPYGRMKKRIEDTFRNRGQFKALRLSYVVSAKDRFVSYCLSCIKKNETAEVFHPFYRNCIVVSDVAETVIWLLDHWEEYEPVALNVAGVELVSRVRIADELNRIMGGKLSYTVVRPERDFFQNRPAITQMRSLYLEQYGILEKLSFTEKIQRQLGGLETW